MEPNEYMAWRMEKVNEITDVEKRHYEADKLLLEVARSHNYHEMAEIFANMKKWYSCPYCGHRVTE